MRQAITLKKLYLILICLFSLNAHALTVSNNTNELFTIRITNTHHILCKVNGGKESVDIPAHKRVGNIQIDDPDCRKANNQFIFANRGSRSLPCLSPHRTSYTIFENRCVSRS